MTNDRAEELGVTVEEWSRQMIIDIQEYAKCHQEDGDKRMTEKEFDKDFGLFVEKGQP